MDRVYNFSPGPSMLALPVLEKAQKDLVAYGDTGMSVMEMSHRSKMYTDIYDKTVADLRELMNIPEDYEVLFLQGGATQQFSAIPLNLMVTGKADYLDTGNFAHLAAEEAKRYGEVSIPASSREDNYTYIPDLEKASYTPDADYLHFTQNNTIYGTRFVELPKTAAPLVCDASSMILSEPMDVSKYGVIYAGAQKNIGPSGLCVLIVRRDLLGKASAVCPKLLNWEVQAKAGSMYNTPNTWGIYLAGLTFEWLKELGGVEVIERANIAKAALLYDFLDESKLFKPTAQKKYRSRMNVTFVTGDEEKDAAFVKAAAKEGLVNLKGHRTVGGMRASIYNAMPEEGVRKLVAFMKKFEVENG
ncbi:MAG: 3-phosphoserine/phosphohydroxythreonine transaminase [Christensenellaceae bacterium]|nr:3-phosphoserine/phosphohydroxythreonine transaminase [Christensenellaceae bacterium]